jgi:hypothetical protein
MHYVTLQSLRATGEAPSHEEITVRPAPNQFRFARAAGAATVLAVLAVVTPALAISVTVNGNPVNLSPPPIERAGRVFVPLRGLFEQLGASVVYENGVINATAGSQTVSLTIGSQQATVDGAPQTVDVAPFIVGASTYVPLRFVSQALGATVNYDGANQIVAVSTASAPSESYAPPPSYATAAVDIPPPPLPEYEQPPCPAPNLIWTPGYWAWSPNGYYWVPGTWVAAPQPGYLWTPGYWAFGGGNYGWHPGFWGIHIGFYGGINYGGGYFGHGYDGGRWDGNHFDYNTAVSRVNTTVITNTYINKTVINNYNTTKVSYNGPSGVKATPTPAERTALAEHHVPLTPEQKAHVVTASQDRNLLATVNHGKPPVAAVEKPLSPDHPIEKAEPVKDEDKAGGEGHLKSGSAAPEDLDKLPPEKPKTTEPVEKPKTTEPVEKPKTTEPIEKPKAEPKVMEPTPKPKEMEPVEKPKPKMVEPTPKPKMMEPKPKPVVHKPAVKPTVHPEAKKPEPKPEHPEEEHKATPKPEDH